MKKQLLQNQLIATLILSFSILIPVYFFNYFNKNNLMRVYLYNKCTSYESAIDQANKDIANGKLYIFLRGLLDYDSLRDVRLRKEEEKYNFKYISLGCVGSDNYTHVYEQIMRRKINENAQKYIFRTFDKYTIEYFKSKYNYVYQGAKFYIFN